MKFTCADSHTADLHWQHCEKSGLPYIAISHIGKTYSNVFFDITNLKGDLEAISAKVQRFYLSYVDFWLIPHCDVEHLWDQHYFFNLWVRTEHREVVAEQLFVYLVSTSSPVQDRRTASI